MYEKFEAVFGTGSEVGRKLPYGLLSAILAEGMRQRLDAIEAIKGRISMTEPLKSDSISAEEEEFLLNLQ